MYNLKDKASVQQVLDEISGASIDLLNKMIDIYKEGDLKLSEEISVIMSKFGASTIEFENDMDMDISTKFSDIREKIKKKKLDSAQEELGEMDFVTLRQRSGIHPDRTREIVKAKSDKTETLKNYKNILQLRQKYEALVQLHYFLKDIDEGETFHMERYLQRNRSFSVIMKNTLQ